MKENVEFKKIREFGDIIGDTFLFIKQNFKPLFKVIIYLCGIFIIAGMLSSLLTQLQLVGMVSAKGGMSTMNNPFSLIYNLGFNYILLIAFLMLNYTAINVTVLSYISLYIQKGNVAPDVVEVWAYFKYYFFRVFGSGLLVTILFIFCLLLCIVPGVYVFPAFTLFFPIMILENGGFSHSFSRSFKLLKGEWWVTAAVLIVIYIIFYAFTMIMQLPASIIMMVSVFTHAANPITETYAIVSSILQYVAQIFMIIPIIGAAICYFNLVERKENAGLINRIDGFGTANSNPINSTPEEY